ncbi:MAG: hypothetical protein II131_02870, partial [Neisseriaceae bacterium]|nr:hypothetical protein [Neisseriaceae bacterium]
TRVRTFCEENSVSTGSNPSPSTADKESPPENKCSLSLANCSLLTANCSLIYASTLCIKRL